MQVQIYAPHEPLPDALTEHILRTVDDGLAHLAPRLTRVEIHLQDLNANKGGIDKRCVIEARPKGLDPLAAKADGLQFHEAVRSAVEKMRRVLDRRFGKLSSRD